MQSDTTHIVNLEVTVPRIVFANDKSHEAQYTNDDEVQVHLMPVGEQQRPSTGEASAHMIHTIRFRLFRIQLPALGRPLLFHALRRWQKPTATRQGKENAAQEHDEGHSVTDASAFSVEFRSQSDASEKAASQATGQAIHPGLNRVIIYLNHEHVPSSYTIDGA